MNIIDPTDIIKWTPADMAEVYLETPDDFLKVKETLSRIGVESKREVNVLFQSCHILHKRGRYYIVHFKELFLLDEKPSTFTKDDLARRNTITILLSDWGLLKIVNVASLSEVTDLKRIKIIPHKEKKEWDLRPKYSIGTKKV